jgi:predicted esterase
MVAGCASPSISEPAAFPGKSTVRSSPPTSEPAGPAIAPADRPADSAQLDPEQGDPTDDEPFIDLPVPGFGAAVVSIPRGAAGPRPVLVATHGAGDRPEWQCEVWRGMIGDGGFVLCPRGRALGDWPGYYYPNHFFLSDELTASLAALKERFAGRVDLDAPLFAGYSQGATMGSLVLPKHAAGFRRAVLIEGGYGHFGEWTLQSARRFHAAGGDRVILACGQGGCAQTAKRTKAVLEKAGIQTRLVYVQGSGHTYGGPMANALRDVFRWLVEEDPRWKD